MPFSALNALAARVAWLLSSNSPSIENQIESGRIATMLFAVVAGLFIFLWSKSLYGVVSGLFGLILYFWDPNILAHSQLVTTDIYAAGMTLIATYSLWKFCNQRSWVTTAWLALSLGLSQLAKYSCVFLFPLFLILIVIYDLPTIAKQVTSRDFKALAIYLKKMFTYGIFVIIMSILLINIGFLFNQTGKELGEYKFKSTTFQSIQQRLSVFNEMPVPLPYPYLQGLDEVRFRERSGVGFGNIYLLGQLRKDGFPGYYLVAYLYKVPLAIQFLFLVALISYLMRGKFTNFRENELFLIGPILFFTIYFNLFNQAQIGFRYFLVAMPFIYIFSSSLLRDWQQQKAAKKFILISMAIYLVISTMSYYPHFIPYFNEIVMDRRLAYKKLADSNLDWGQADGYARRFLEMNPATLIELDKPEAGQILISVNDLVGITSDPETYQWLRENFVPEETVAYAYLVYRVSPDQLEIILNRVLP